MSTFRGAALASLSLLACAASGAAQEVAASSTTLTLEQRVEALERRVPPTAPAPPWTRHGFWLSAPNRADFRLRLGGVLQSDDRAFLTAAPNGADEFLVRRARIYVEGVIQDHIEFRILPDFASGQSLLQEAWVDFNDLPELRLQAGKMKAPLSLERLVADVDTLFVERGLPQDIAPNRDVGAQLHGQLFNRRAEYALAVVNGAADGASDDADSDNNKDFVGRLFLTPFRGSGPALFEDLGVGMAGSYGRQRDGGAAGLPAYSSEAQLPFFSYLTGVAAAGERERLMPQAYWYAGPFGVLGEYVSSSQQVAKGAASTTLTNRAWQAAASWVLTGEKRAYEGVKPKTNFDPKNRGWGAFELAGRYSALWIDRAAFPVYASPTASARRADAESAGLNWYLNGNVRVAVDYLRTVYAGGPRYLEQAVFSRVQLSF
ncbi:MAG TPA: porin [Elusimicrobiota bacterium]|nr:porin [Elusimicrobiota bacterium]